MLPSGVTTTQDPEEAVCHVAVPRGLEAETAAAEAEAETAAAEAGPAAAAEASDSAEKSE